jgi:hypothetical protein
MLIVAVSTRFVEFSGVSAVYLAQMERLKRSSK